MGETVERCLHGCELELLHWLQHYHQNTPKKHDQGKSRLRPLLLSNSPDWWWWFLITYLARFKNANTYRKENVFYNTDIYAYRAFKGTVQPNIISNYIFSLLPLALFIHLNCFGVSCQLNMSTVSWIKLKTRWLVVLEVARNCVRKTEQHQRFLPEIMTQLDKIIHRPYCEPFPMENYFLFTGGSGIYSRTRGKAK